MKKNRLVEYDEYTQIALKEPRISSKMDKEKVLKRICKHHLMNAFVLGRAVGKFSSKPKYKDAGEFIERLFKNQHGFGLTMSLKKAGVLPLPIYGEKKAA